MAVKKTKAKEWFTIVAPKYFDEKEFGKTIVSEPEKLLNRRVSINALELSNDFSKYYLKFIFRVVAIDGNRALTEFDGSECMRDYISRMVLRRVKRIDTIQDLMTKDGIKIRVKGICVVSRKINTSVLGTVRNDIRKMLENIVKESTLEEFVKTILSDEIKNRILQEARKIYPIRNFEIRKTEILK